MKLQADLPGPLTGGGCVSSHNSWPVAGPCPTCCQKAKVMVYGVNTDTYFFVTLSLPPPSSPKTRWSLQQDHPQAHLHPHPLPYGPRLGLGLSQRFHLHPPVPAALCLAADMGLWSSHLLSCRHSARLSHEAHCSAHEMYRCPGTHISRLKPLISLGDFFAAVFLTFRIAIWGGGGLEKSWNCGISPLTKLTILKCLLPILILTKMLLLPNTPNLPCQLIQLPEIL